MFVFKNVILIALFLTTTIKCARILCVFHMSSYSHYILGNTLLKELAARGHEVTMISSFDQQPPIKNYRTILVNEVPELVKGKIIFLYKFLDGNMKIEQAFFRMYL